MKSTRRNFIRTTASLAALSGIGNPALSAGNRLASAAKDASIDLCLAYFWGIEPRKVALARQMDVLGAVGGINPAMAGLPGRKNYEFEVIKGVKEAWEREGLQPGGCWIYIPARATALLFARAVLHPWAARAKM
ncbi:MAG: hypothetical protein KDD12_01505 [Lewinella sp.]|nr:hypothetical protein [Lewinella sp.]